MAALYPLTLPTSRLLLHDRYRLLEQRGEGCLRYGEPYPLHLQMLLHLYQETMSRKEVVNQP